MSLLLVLLVLSKPHFCSAAAIMQPVKHNKSRGYGIVFVPKVGDIMKPLQELRKALTCMLPGQPRLTLQGW